jgi:hypothetical protein
VGREAWDARGVGHVLSLLRETGDLAQEVPHSLTVKLEDALGRSRSDWACVGSHALSSSA